MITSFGASIKRRGAMFEVRTPDGQRRIAAQKIESIWIATGAMLTTDAVALALERNIDIVFLDQHGDPLGRVWHPRLGSTAAIRRAQLVAGLDTTGTELALGWVRRKLGNQADLLRRSRDRRTRISADLTRAIRQIERNGDALGNVEGDLDQRRGQIMGLEGASGRAYFGALALLVPEEHRFQGRSRNPARNPFNCLLNYGYGVLYSLVERACILAGLDPCLGFLHTDNYAKPSLVFDFIEPHRVYVEEVVLDLFVKRRVDVEGHFRELENGFTLAKLGKGLLMECLNAHLDDRILRGNRRCTRRHSIQLEAHKLARVLIESPGETTATEGE